MQEYRIGAYFNPRKIRRLMREANADIASTVLMNLRSYRGPLARYDMSNTMPVTVHAPYTINLAHSDAWIKSASRTLLTFNAMLAAEVGATGLTVHGGTFKGSNWHYALDNWKWVRDQEWPCRILIENAASRKWTCTADLGQIADMFEFLSANPMIGVTYDTAHSWAFTKTDYDMIAYTRGLRNIVHDRIWLVHSNGSAALQGSEHDKHAPFAESALSMRLITECIRESGCLDLVCETKDPVADVRTLRNELAKTAPLHETMV